ncbi:hypothetical protein, partial [Escherichia coli]|uniref:hypothetical protein n=1 Tax=Escherichia coli TaxID=562 RepID=UPI001BCA534D
RYFSDTTFLNSNENFSMHPQFLVWCLTFGAHFKNDGHYFCRAGGNRPDGLNEPVTILGNNRTNLRISLALPAGLNSSHNPA